MVYINEAHAVDVWNIGMSAGTINYSHKVIDDRIKCAIKFRDTFDVEFPIYADNMADEFETKYASWPIRVFAVNPDGTIGFISHPRDSELDLNELLEYMESV